MVVIFPASQAYSQSDDIKELMATVKAMQKTIATQNTRIATLEKQQQQAPGGQPVITSGTSPSPDDHNAFHDKHDFAGNRQAAPRVNNAPSDSSLAGFIKIPGTEAMFKIGGTVRLDVIADRQNNGNPNEFVTSTIPVPGQPGWNSGGRTTLQTKGTRLTLELRQPVPFDDTLRIYSEFDFFNDSSSSSMSLRTRHFYAQAWNLLVGQTFSTFMDIDVYPDVIDYEGPNAIIYRRQPQIRYTLPVYDKGRDKVHLFASLEQPVPEVNTNTSGPGATASSRVPDGVVGARWESAFGHVQGAALFRDLSLDNDNRGRMNVFGWGGSLSSALHVFGKDTISGQVTYGKGIGHYVNDLGGESLDAAYDGTKLEAIPVFAATAAFTHQWSERWCSTVSGGYILVDAPESLGPFAIDNTVYASVNLMWRPTTSMRVGLEYLYGSKATQNGAERDAHRLDFVIRYDLVK